MIFLCDSSLWSGFHIISLLAVNNLDLILEKDDENPHLVSTGSATEPWQQKCESHTHEMELEI